ncbi:DNA gyrase inhibitor YacG [candidate division KSB1 bacterium]|nr:DNA gyrase inhibitor YacG [candidate division KSB1 bacterium]
MTELTCAICGKTIPTGTPADKRPLPFCSERCRKIDLGRWLGERYRVSQPLSGGLEEEEGM